MIEQNGFLYLFIEYCLYITIQYITTLVNMKIRRGL